MSLLDINKQKSLLGKTSSSIDTPSPTINLISNDIPIDPVDEPTPLSQLGIGDPIYTQISKPKPDAKNIDPNCYFPSAVVVALIVVSIIAAFIIIYIYIQPVDRNLGFANILVIELIDINDERLEKLNLAFIITLVMWIFVLGSLILVVETPYKIGGKLRPNTEGRSPGTERLIQYDIYILLINIIFMILAIISIVYYNNWFFALIFSLIAIVILLWHRNINLYLLAIFETFIIVIFGVKFMVPGCSRSNRRPLR